MEIDSYSSPISFSICSAKSCGKEINPNSDSFTRTAVNTKRTKHSAGLPKKKQEMELFKINWNLRGRAIFHVKCFENFLKNIATLEPREQQIVEEADETAEYFESPAELDKKIELLIPLIRSSKHLSCFTGAGISTSSGIGDYRGINGKWTLQDHEREEPEESNGIPYEQLVPSLTHKSLVTLQNKGVLKYVISQNCDGLHLRSGLKKPYLSELHGNVFVEYCEQCNHEYFRDFYVCDDDSERLLERRVSKSNLPLHVKECERCKLNHHTPRRCDDCDCYLRDTIINFGDLLRNSELGPAKKHALETDLMISLGSSMLVTPASDLVAERVGRNKKLIIVNLQKTKFDSKATLRFFSTTDMFFEKLMKRLE